MPRSHAARAWARLFAGCLMSLALACSAAAQTASPASGSEGWKLDSETFEGLRARALGPGVMSGRISCIDGVSGERNTLWVGTAGGGVWRSRDNGTTWRPVFDGVSIALALGAMCWLLVDATRSIVERNK